MINALLTKEDIRKFIFEAMCEHGNNEVLTRIQFKQRFNLTEYQLLNYLEQGLPWIGKPTRKKFDVNQCKRWFDENTRKL